MVMVKINPRTASVCLCLLLITLRFLQRSRTWSSRMQTTRLLPGFCVLHWFSVFEFMLQIHSGCIALQHQSGPAIDEIVLNSSPCILKDPLKCRCTWCFNPGSLRAAARSSSAAGCESRTFSSTVYDCDDFKFSVRSNMWCYFNFHCARACLAFPCSSAFVSVLLLSGSWLFNRWHIWLTGA